MHPEIFEVLENAPWQRTATIRPTGTTDADREGKDGSLPAWVPETVLRLERAVHELGQWRSQVESREGASSGHSEPGAVGAPKLAAPGLAVDLPVSAEDFSTHRPVSHGAIAPGQPIDLQVSPSFRKSRKTACKLEQSIWDASLLMGAEGHGRATTAWAVMLLLLNILVQGVFAYIVSNDLTAQKYTDARTESYRDWRIHTGHAFAEYDPISNRSLAARVCSNEPGLAVSNTQAHAFKEITGGYIQYIYVLVSHVFRISLVCGKVSAMIAWVCVL